MGQRHEAVGKHPPLMKLNMSYTPIFKNPSETSRTHVKTQHLTCFHKGMTWVVGIRRGQASWILVHSIVVYEQVFRSGLLTCAINERRVANSKRLGLLFWR